MFTMNRSRRLTLMTGLLCTFPVIACGADPAGDVTIDGPWAQPLVIRIVTVDAAPPQVETTGATPDQPQRIAMVVRHPATGEAININLVESAERLVELTTWRGRSYTMVETVINDDRPFTLDAEAQAAVEGVDIRQANNGAYPTGDQATGWWSGDPVVEILVSFAQDRAAFTHYAIRVVSPMRGDARFKTRGDGPKEGGDPGGNPDPPNIQGEEGGDGDPENGDGDDGDGGDGGDPGGNPDPPLQALEG